MANLKQYTYPVFMGVSGFLTTVSDLIQKNDIAIFVAASLAAIGIITSVAPRSWLSRIRGIFSSLKEEKDNFSFKCLGVSCLLMAAAVFGFSTLSVKAAPEGGIIASQYPEIREIQITLGIMQSDIAQIKNQVGEINDKSDKILSATFPWLELSIEASFSNKLEEIDGQVQNVNYPGGSFVWVRNETPMNFEDVSILITNSLNKNDYYKENYKFIGSNDTKQGQLVSKLKMYASYNVCYSAKVKGRKEWIVDTFEVKGTHDFATMKSDDWYKFRYEKLDYDGPQIYSVEKRCQF
ncbi:hypothetical protein KUG47_06400 [Falsochrobactrum sp. TDYN1]|uniref:Uncharacterized protein n=1 Tax=Falsochrobactrum tianjinense TaxID=2706015 RepID=A0A949PL99_9HYPH|nr:hypothetical protein [Falsochrobactrum sp. TDYN1]MBV2143123.1 hypothetical protein [Falsochrobactrum sp. TDYN1]